MKKIILLLLIAGVCLQVGAQSVLERLQTHVTYLADDKLEGRATGSEGEMLAARYIVGEFKTIGLQPVAENGNNFLDEFSANRGKELGDRNFISFLNKTIVADSFHFPHPMSASGLVSAKAEYVGYGISATQLNHDDYAGKDVKNKIVLIQLSSPESDSPHSKFAEYADERMKIKTAAANGAIGIIFFNTDSLYEDPSSNYSRNISPENIPVFLVDVSTAEQVKKYSGEINLSVELNPVVIKGHNVLGYIDNGAANTVVIGAHYDHLGHGETGGSLYRGEPAIHNGADDNASGVGVIIELARKLKSSNLKNNNYLFIAFSGEEMGLLGSNDFVHSDLMKEFSFNYMLNFDMVGRLDSSSRTLLVNGIGTSPAWDVVKKVDSAGLHIKTTEPGIGPSDQTSFYLRDIPVLFFFTGTHSDYHKPSDDIEKVNFSGMKQVLSYAYNIIEEVNDDNKIVFTKTNDAKQEDTPSFKVTLGVIPDYAFEGRGMRIDGVTDGKPASKAGLLAGDVVIQLGAYEVADMMSYMKALGKFSKGEKTTVIVLRNNSQLSFLVEF